MSDEAKTFSIALRLRRVIHEDAYVAIPVTDAIIELGEDGKGSINFDALVAEAIRLSADPRVEWKTESCQVEPHPTQQPKPDDRYMFDIFYDAPTA